VKDHYAVLGVARYSDKKTVKTAYRALAKRYHPDRGPGHELQFKEVQQAYDVLSGSGKDTYDAALKASSSSGSFDARDTYDRVKKQQPNNQQSGYGPAWGYDNPTEDWRVRFARQQNEARREQRERMDQVRREHAEERIKYREDTNEAMRQAREAMNERAWRVTAGLDDLEGSYNRTRRYIFQADALVVITGISILLAVVITLF